MSSQNLGIEFTCDACGKKEIGRDAKPHDWTCGHFKVDSGWTGPFMHFCESCWGHTISSDAAKAPLLARLFGRKSNV